MRLQTHLLVAAALMVIATTSISPAEARGPGPKPDAGGARIVNVTTDSERGWLPSEDQARSASEAATAYLAARDSGRSEEAYGMLEEGNRSLQPLTDYARDLASFNRQAGVVLERRVLNVTWTKNPAQAPKPGVYAAIDLLGRFQNVDRHCGYVVVYQEPTGGPFRVIREESNFLTNADAQAIERQQSKAAVASSWSQLAARCPNYPGESPPSSSEPLPEQPGSIGYPTVAAALIALRSQPHVSFRSEGGWTVATDEGSMTIWTFASEGQPAYPAAIKRQIISDEQGGSTLQMSVRCEASKASCDELVRTFEALNARMTAELRGKR